MIRVGYGDVSVVGSKAEIMAEVAVLLHALPKKEILTWDDIESTIKYAKMSDAEIAKNYRDSIKESIQASKKELLDAFSKILDDTFSE